MAIRTALDRIFSRVTPLAGDETYSQEIVGESHYQDALEKIVGGRTEDSAEHYCEAMMVPEKRNQYDPNAVAVFIRGKKVGHLSKRDAANFREELTEIGCKGRRTRCGAVVVGGWLRDDGDWGHFGVKLDLARPIEPQ